MKNSNGSGQPVPFAYLTLDLENCGFYIPSTVGQTVTMVQKHLQLRQNQLPAAIYGNNEITCGNPYSTLWHVTAWADSNTKLAGDLDYDLCSSLSNCLGAATPLSVETPIPLFGGAEHKAEHNPINVTNKVALYNFLSTFSGTHFLTPRTYTAELGFHF